MKIQTIYSDSQMIDLAKARFAEERRQDYLEGWFLAGEIRRDCDLLYQNEPDCLRIAKTQREVMKKIPLQIGDYHVFAGTQDDAFARSYALINPTFRVDSFEGYCDPTAVFDDIQPRGAITQERIEDLRAYHRESRYTKRLEKAYQPIEKDTGEALFFVEQVTGHLIPDFRQVLEKGTVCIKRELEEKRRLESDPQKSVYFEAMQIALEGVEILAKRYAAIAAEQKRLANGQRRDFLALLQETLERVPYVGATTLFEAMQSFLLLWQTMCLEQAPNPFAFSVGNADRIFEPYRAREQLAPETMTALFTHFLVFFNVADRSWAISQNVLVGGRAVDGRDLTSPSTYAILDAYFLMNLPQPILSVKLHRHTPDALYQKLGKFFFTAGMLTPSLFNDDALFEVLEHAGIAREDVADYAVAGCQEPLIMGKDNGNTTNSWLNLPKILELTINDGRSSITGQKLGNSYAEMGCKPGDVLAVLQNIRALFYRNLEEKVDRMVEAANAASAAVSELQVPFLSCFMGGQETGIDLRDAERQGTKYNASGCLVHGLSIMADSFCAIDTLLAERPQDAARLAAALANNFEGEEELRQFLLSCPKYGNHLEASDKEAKAIAREVCAMLRRKKNYLGNPFRPDFSTPSTHLMYGFWVGATPDGRKAREMLGYGIDPLYGEAQQGLGFRVLSNMELPFLEFCGGYASHFGIDPAYFRAETEEEKGLAFQNKVIHPLFFNPIQQNTAPFYLYVNVTTPEILRKVLDNPKKYAPSGVYIVRIHGTFVNFLDLSPEIQQDIIKRLDLPSTRNQSVT